MANLRATGDQTAAIDAADLHKHLWAMMFVGLAIGVLAMYLAVQRPMQTRMASVESEMLTIQRQMRSLTGMNGTAKQVGDLLTNLTEQRNQLDEARGALADMQRLHRRVDAEARQAGIAGESLDRITALQESLICQDASTETAGVALDRLANLKETLIVQGKLTAPAARALSEMVALEYALIDEQQTTTATAAALGQIRGLIGSVRAAATDARLARSDVAQLGELKTEALLQVDGVNEARHNLGRFVELKQQAIAAGQGIDEADARLDRLANLKETVIDETDDLETARIAAEELLSVKDALVVRGGNTFVAQGNADRLMSLRDALSVERGTIDTATQNLDSLLHMQSKLTSRTRDIVEAIETLDLLSDLRNDIDRQVLALEGMKRSMVEVVLLEGAVEKAVRVLQPLAEMKNLNRLSDREIRQMARTLHDDRFSRVAQRTALLEPLQADVIAPAASDNSLRTIFGVEASGEQDVPVPQPLEAEYSDAAE